MPASGASTTRFGIVIPPSFQRSVSDLTRLVSPARRDAPPFALAFGAVTVRARLRRRHRSRSPSATLHIPLVEQPQARQCEQRVDVVDLLAEGHDSARQSSGGDRRRVVAELLAQPAEHAVDLGGEAVDHARPDRLDGRLPDQRARRLEVDLRDRRRAAGECLHRDLDARPDDAADVLAGGPDDVVRDRGAEVDDHACAADALVRRDRVDEPVGADLARVVDPDRHAAAQPGPDDRHRVAEIALRHRRPLRPQLRHRRGEDRRVEVGERQVAQREQVAQPRAQLVGGLLAHRRVPPVVHQLLAAERPHVRLRVAGVDYEQHRPDYARRPMAAVLYAFPASHPCAAAERALQLKALPYRRVDMLPGIYPALQRARFGARTVPGVEFEDGTRVVGSRPILRALEERAPEPALLPADGDLRARVERAEEWGDQVLQPLARRLIWAALRRSPASVPSYAEGARLPVPRALARASAPLTALWGQARNLDRADRWIAGGTLGGVEPNAADLQIGASLALLLTVGDLRPLLDARPAAHLARRWFPDYPGAVPGGTLP